jgi:hypothetical protein
LPLASLCTLSYMIPDKAQTLRPIFPEKWPKG